MSYLWWTDIPGAYFTPDPTFKDPYIHIPLGAVGSWRAGVIVTETPPGCPTDLSDDLVIPPPPPEISAPGDPVPLTLWKSGEILFMEYGTAPDIELYRIVRGVLGDYYSHMADDETGAGICLNQEGTTFADWNDLSESGDFYYLVIGLSYGLCEGSYGLDSPKTGPPSERPPRTPTASCP